MKQWLLKKLMPKHKVNKGDLVTSLNGGPVYEVEATYYDENFNPILMVRDQEQKRFGVDADMLRPYGGSVNI